MHWSKWREGKRKTIYYGRRGGVHRGVPGCTVPFLSLQSHCTCKGVLDRMGRRQLKFLNDHWVLLQKKESTDEWFYWPWTLTWHRARKRDRGGNKNKWQQHHPLSREPFSLLLPKRNEILTRRDGVNTRITSVSLFLENTSPMGSNAKRRGFPSQVSGTVFPSLPQLYTEKEGTLLEVSLAFQQH